MVLVVLDQLPCRKQGHEHEEARQTKAEQEDVSQLDVSKDPGDPIEATIRITLIVSEGLRLWGSGQGKIPWVHHGVL